MSDFKGTWLRARNKINKATEWRGTVNVAVDGENVTFAHRLLDEEEFSKVRQSIPLKELKEHRDKEASEEEERLQELQRKDELDDEEEEELEELSEIVAEENADIEEAFGEEAYETLMWAGEQAIMPTEEDIKDILEMNPADRAEMFDKGGSIMWDEAEEALKEDIVDVIDDQPYPIKLNVGMQAFSETVQVRGNGLRPKDSQ